MKFNSLQKDYYHVNDNHHHRKENGSLINETNGGTITTTTAIPATIHNNNYHKSCDTIDKQSSGLNYYSLHSILSYVAENRCLSSSSSSAVAASAAAAASDANNKSYKLHDTITKQKSKKLTTTTTNDQYYKYNQNYLASLRLQRQLYLAIRFSFGKSNHRNHTTIKKSNLQNKTTNKKFILVKNLPYLQNYYHHDDSIDDPLRKFLQDNFELQNHLYLLFRNQSKKLLFIKDDSDISINILLNNLLESFKLDFKQYNFQLNIDDYYDRQSSSTTATKSKTGDNRSIQDHILDSYLNSFKLF